MHWVGARVCAGALPLVEDAGELPAGPTPQKKPVRGRGDTGAGAGSNGDGEGDDTKAMMLGLMADVMHAASSGDGDDDMAMISKVGWGGLGWAGVGWGGLGWAG